MTQIWVGVQLTRCMGTLSAMDCRCLEMPLVGDRWVVVIDKDIYLVGILTSEMLSVDLELGYVCMN